MWENRTSSIFSSSERCTFMHIYVFTKPHTHVHMHTIPHTSNNSILLLLVLLLNWDILLLMPSTHDFWFWGQHVECSLLWRWHKKSIIFKALTSSWKHRLQPSVHVLIMYAGFCLGLVNTAQIVDHYLLSTLSFWFLGCSVVIHLGVRAKYSFQVLCILKGLL